MCGGCLYINVCECVGVEVWEVKLYFILYTRGEFYNVCMRWTQIIHACKMSRHGEPMCICVGQPDRASAVSFEIINVRKQ